LKAPTSGDAGSVRQAENSRETRVGRPFGRARFAAEPSVEFQFGSSAEVMPCFMRQREGKRFRSYSFMAYQTAEQPHTPATDFDECLGIGDFDTQIHVVDDPRKADLESLDQRHCAAFGPRRFDWPKETTGNRRIEQGHSRNMLPVALDAGKPPALTPLTPVPRLPAP